MIASKEYVLKKLEENNLFPMKKFSQNFLINSKIATEIVDLLSLQEKEKIIEIGPGLGALSEIILNKQNSLTCYEIDKRMCEHLNKVFSIYDNFSLIEGDFIKKTINNKCEVKVISNLPYALTTPMIEKVIFSIKKCPKFVFMVQKEVSERLEAKVGTKEYSPLTIILKHVGNLKREFLVTKNNFFPIPNVDSLVYSISFFNNRNYEFDNAFYRFLKSSFLLRRKTLLNNLASVYEKEKILTSLKKNHLEATIRPEQISYEQYLALFHELTK